MKNRPYVTIVRMLAALFFLMIVSDGCMKITDAERAADANLQMREDPEYRFEFLYLFNTTFGDSTVFTGTKICSLTVNDTLKNSTEYDNAYFRIVHRKDTLLSIDGSTIGRAQIKMEDINNWSTVAYLINNRNDLIIGSLLADFIDSSSFAAIAQTCSTAQMPSDAQKTVILAACNKIIATQDFYYRYRHRILEIAPFQDLQPQLNRFINESIMADTTGTITGGTLSEYATEALKWFNVELFLREFDFFYDAEQPRMFKIHLSSPRVHILQFEERPSVVAPPSSVIERYIAVNFSQIQQLSYKDGMGMHTLASRKISPYPFTTSLNWEVTPLYGTDIPVLPGSALLSVQFPGQALIEYKGANSSQRDLIYYAFKCYYPLCRTIRENSNPVYVSGAITLAIGFENIVFVYNPARAATLLSWNAETTIQTRNVDGQTKTYKEHLMLNAQ